jgi:hypothetical protein
MHGQRLVKGATWSVAYVSVLGVAAGSGWGSSSLLVLRLALTGICAVSAGWFLMYRGAKRAREAAREAEILRTRARLRDASWLN